MKSALTRKYSPKFDHRKTPNHLIIIIVGVILFFGILFLSSASSVFSYKKFGSAYYMVFRQIIFGLIPGIALFYIFSKIDYRKYLKISRYFLPLSIALLLLVFIPGIVAQYGSSRSWINIFGFSLQPSELVKITFLIFLAGWIEKKGYQEITDFRRGLAPFVMYLGMIAFLLMLQPDIGMLMVVTFMSLMVFFTAGAKIHHLVYILTSGIIAFVIVILNKPYIADRIKVFLNPGDDSLNLGYQIQQAFLAIGSGGIFGVGFGKSAQKFSYLPEVSSDSIFAVIAEEMGFVVVLVLIILYLMLMYQGILTAQKASDPFGRFLAIGITSWLTFQAFLNVAVMTGLAPLTGITLPFISAGGTSLVTSLMAIGILVNISKYRME